MSRRCVICSHPQRPAIEKQIATGMSMVLLGQRYQTNNDALLYHQGTCMNRAVVARVNSDPVTIFQEHNEAEAEAKRLIEFSKGEVNLVTGLPVNAEVVDVRGWSLGLREWRGLLDQKAKMSGAYDQIDSRFLRAYIERIVHVIDLALEDHPEVKKKLLAAIKDVEANG